MVLPDLVLDCLGAQSASHQACLLYQRMLRDLSQETPLTLPALGHALGVKPSSLVKDVRQLEALGLLRVREARPTLTVVGDSTVLDLLDHRRKGRPLGLTYQQLSESSWVSDGCFPQQGFGYAPTLSLEDAYQHVREEALYWRRLGLKLPVAKRSKEIDHTKDELRQVIEDLQAYANEAFDAKHSLYTKAGKQVGQGGGKVSRYRAIHRALTEWNYTPEQLRSYIDRIGGDPWWRERKLLDTARVFNDQTRIDRYLQGASEAELLKFNQETEAEAF